MNQMSRTLSHLFLHHWKMIRLKRRRMMKMMNLIPRFFRLVLSCLEFSSASLFFLHHRQHLSLLSHSVHHSGLQVPHVFSVPSSVIGFSMASPDVYVYLYIHRSNGLWRGNFGTWHSESRTWTVVKIRFVRNGK